MQLVVFAPFLQDLKEDDGAAAVAAVSAGSHGDVALVVVVAGRALLEELTAQLAGLEDRVNPFLLGFFSRFDGVDVSLAALGDDIGDVLGLLVGDVDEVWGERRLDDADEETVGEAPTGPAVEG